jgi:hypothetical protein
MTTRIHDLLGRTELLGVEAGKAAADKLLGAAAVPKGAAVVILDFDGIELITASAARESVFKLCAAISAEGALPVLVNANEATADELTFAAQALKQPLVLAELAADGSLTRPKIRGSLEPVQRETLDVVAQLGEADAKAATAALGTSTAGATAWNNRLASLAGLRLLQERKVGKTKLYSLTLKGLAYGN